MQKAERAVVVGIVVVVAAALRVAFVATADVQVPLRVDAGQYAQYAENLVEHGVYSLEDGDAPRPDSFRSPGFPLLLALCRLVAGADGWYDLARWLQVVLSTLTVLAAYALARTFLGFAPALAAAALAALSPHLVVAPAYVLTECLTTFACTAGLWLAFAGRGRPAVAAGGALLGVAVRATETLVFAAAVVALPQRGGSRAPPRPVALGAGGRAGAVRGVDAAQPDQRARAPRLRARGQLDQPRQLSGHGLRGPALVRVPVP